MTRIRASILVRKASSLQRVNDCHRALESPRSPGHLQLHTWKPFGTPVYSAAHITSTTETTPRLIQTMFPNVAHLTLSITTASEQTPRLAKGPAPVRWGLLRFTLSRTELSLHCIAPAAPSRRAETRMIAMFGFGRHQDFAGDWLLLVYFSGWEAS